jgi:hypothetical protein
MGVGAAISGGKTTNVIQQHPRRFAVVLVLIEDPLLQCDEIADHLTCVSSHASASSNEKEYSWSRTPERILPPSAKFMM